MNQDQVVELMKSSKSAEEWNDNTRKVKEAFGGDYPNFWGPAIIVSGVAREVAASFGVKAEIGVATSSRRPIPHLHGRPNQMPYLSKGEQVVGVYDQGLGERDSLCTTLEDMQQLYDSYAQGYALTLKWFIVSTATISIPV